MPGIAALGKLIFLIFNRFGRKSLLLKSNRRYPDEASTAVKTRRLFSWHVSQRSRAWPAHVTGRREDNPVRTGAAMSSAHAPCKKTGGGVAG